MVDLVDVDVPLPHTQIYHYPFRTQPIHRNDGRDMLVILAFTDLTF